MKYTLLILALMCTSAAGQTKEKRLAPAVPVIVEQPAEPPVKRRRCSFRDKNCFEQPSRVARALRRLK